MQFGLTMAGDRQTILTTIVPIGLLDAVDGLLIALRLTLSIPIKIRFGIPTRNLSGGTLPTLQHTTMFLSGRLSIYPYPVAQA